MLELSPLLAARRYRHLDSGAESSSLLDFADGGEVDRAGLSDLLAYGYQSGRRTLLSGVERVLPGWDLEPPEIHPRELSTADERADRLWELLREAVSRASSGAARPRTTLSGGLDSRAVAAAAASLDSHRFTVGTFGDADCADLPVAAEAARRLGLSQQEHVFEANVALCEEERVWRATSGYGGPAAAPGAGTDSSWAEQCDVLLSGTSGDVIWGDTGRAGPSPSSRLARLGCPYVAPHWSADLPAAPSWATSAGVETWWNLWTRQQGGTWDGVLSRLALTPVVPIPWDGPLLSYCLGLADEDRHNRALLRRMLDRHAPGVSASALPPVHGFVHDLDRAFRTSPAWLEELQLWVRTDSEAAWQRLGLRRAVVARMLKKALSAGGLRTSLVGGVRASLDRLLGSEGGKGWQVPGVPRADVDHVVGKASAVLRPRAAFLSRLRAAWRWGVLLSESH